MINTRQKESVNVSTLSFGSVGTSTQPSFTTDSSTAASTITNVTNGDFHDHYGGDGATISHTTLSNIGSNTHAQIDTHIASTVFHLSSTEVSQTGVVTGFTQNASSSAKFVSSSSTFTGNYGATAFTLGDIVYALKKRGILST